MNFEQLANLPRSVGTGWGLQRLVRLYPVKEKVPEQVNKNEFVENWLNELTLDDAAEHEAVVPSTSLGIKFYPEGWTNPANNKLRTKKTQTSQHHTICASSSSSEANSQNSVETAISAQVEKRSTVSTVSIQRNLQIVSQVKMRSGELPRISILVHGLNPIPQMCTSLASSNLNVAIQDVLRSTGTTMPTTHQCYSWPSVLRGHNLCLIHSDRIGKTSAILPPLCSLMLDSEGLYKLLPDVPNSPLTIILVCNCIVGRALSVTLTSMLRDTALANAVWFTGLPLNKNDVAERFEQHRYATEIVITTCDTLIELLNSNIINLSRLCHLVVECIDVICELYAKQFNDILRFIDDVIAKRCNYNDVQFIATAARWVPELERIVGTLDKFPLLIFANTKQAAIYARAEFHLQYMKSELKVEKLVETLKAGEYNAHRCIVFCNSNEQPAIRACLSKAGICFDAIHEQLRESRVHDIHASWNSSLDGNHFVLLATDLTFNLLHDGSKATFLINYSIPSGLKKFSNRLNAMLINFVSPFATASTSPKTARTAVYTFVDEVQIDEYPVLSKFFDQTTIEIPPELDDACKKYISKKESINIRDNIPLCNTMKMHGVCNFLACKFRHVFAEHLDMPKQHLLCGKVRGKMLEYLAPNRFLVKCEEYVDSGGGIVRLKNCTHLVAAALRAFQHFEPVDLIKREQIVLYHHGDEMFRCYIYNMRKYAQIKIIGVDNACKRIVHQDTLFKLPESVQALPPSIYEVIIPNVRPPFKEPTWNVNSHARIFQEFTKYNWTTSDCEIDVRLHNQHVIWAYNIRLREDYVMVKDSFSLLAFLKRQRIADYNEEPLEKLTNAWCKRVLN